MTMSLTNPAKLLVAERSILAVPVALLSNIVQVSAGCLERRIHAPAVESGGRASEARWVLVAVGLEALAGGDLVPHATSTCQHFPHEHRCRTLT
jgi:hypothetical protein